MQQFDGVSLFALDLEKDVEGGEARGRNAIFDFRFLMFDLHFAPEGTSRSQSEINNQKS